MLRLPSAPGRCLTGLVLSQTATAAKAAESTGKATAQKMIASTKRIASFALLFILLLLVRFRGSRGLNSSDYFFTSFQKKKSSGIARKIQSETEDLAKTKACGKKINHGITCSWVIRLRCALRSSAPNLVRSERSRKGSGVAKYVKKQE